MSIPSVLSSHSLALTSLLAVVAAGCASPEDDASAAQALAESGEAAAVVLSQESGPKKLAGPNDSYFAEVTPFGSGCPAGTSNTRISADGQVFTTTFSEYEASVNETSDVAIRDCQISIRLHSPSGQSYAVHSFYYQGSAYLQEGVSGIQTAQYYFQGSPIAARSVRSNLQGAYDDDYLFQDDVQTPDEYVWSPCGVDRDLQIVTKLQVQNSKPRRSGYMNLSALDGSTRLEFQLAWKPCQPTSTASTTPPATTPPAQTPPKQSPPQQTPQTPPNNGGIVGTVVDGLGGVVGGLGGTLGGVLGGLLGN